MSEHLLDTNILSKIFYGNADVKNFVDNLIVGVETVVYIECLQGSISNSDKRRIKHSLQSLEFYPLTNDIARKAIELISARDKNNVERYLKMESGCVFELA